jgi:hypothetical protein
MSDESESLDDLLARRNEVIQRITDLNERQLKIENESAGIDFELLACAQAMEADGETPALQDTRAALERRHADASERKQRHEEEGERLMDELDRINTRVNAMK